MVWDRFPEGEDMNLLFNGIESSNEKKWLDKTNWCGGCVSSQGDCCTRRGLGSSSPLRTLAIQTINIFIRGCYL